MEMILTAMLLLQRHQLDPKVQGVDPALVQEAIDAIQGRRTSAPSTKAQNYRGFGNGSRNGNAVGNNGQSSTSR
jgi:hypothetical protein